MDGMNDLIVIRRDIVLEKMASRIFGKDIVDSAYITTWDYGSNINNIWDRLEAESYKKDNKMGIDLDSKNIIVKFRNGNAVYFTNSEWGSISAINMAEKTREP